MKIAMFGRFNCDLGIVDSVSFKKGGQGDCWNADGLPLEIEVSLSIKDLYGTLSIVNEESRSLFFQNIGLLDFIGTTCGVNINQPELIRKLSLFAMYFQNKISDIPGNYLRRWEEGIINTIHKFYGQQ